MKKKLLLLTVLVIALTCLFAIGVSAEVTTYDDAPTRTNITVSTDDVVVFDDGFTCPSAYVFKDSTYLNQKSAMFDFSYINTKTGKTYTYDNLVEVDIPQGVKSSASYTFAGHASLKKVSLPNTFTSIGTSIFENVKKLEECVFEHDEKSGLETIPNWMFANCTSLKAISFPDCVKYFTGNTQLGGCTNLGAIYLSKNLISTEGGGNGNATFGNLTNGYFVNTPFTYDNIPAKPDVYYFPANYYTMSGETFDTCKNLNKVLVFPANNITITNAWTFENVVCDSTTKEKPTIVFKGDVTSVSVGSWNVSAIYFCNKNDTDATSAGVSGSKTIYYCNAEGNSNHLYLVEKSTAPTCTETGVKGYVCFCNAVDKTRSEEIEALGHKASETIIDKYFTKNEDGSYNYFANMVKLCPCSVCTENVEFEMTGTALFETDKGYSFSETDASSFSYTLHVNVDAIKAYLSENTGFKYGVVVSANTASKPINLVDGAINKEVAQTVIVELQGLTNVFEYVVTKLTFAKDYQSSELFCQAFAVDENTVSYIGTNKTSISADVISHAILVKNYDSKEDLENVA